MTTLAGRAGFEDDNDDSCDDDDDDAVAPLERGATSFSSPMLTLAKEGEALTSLPALPLELKPAAVAGGGDGKAHPDEEGGIDPVMSGPALAACCCCCCVVVGP